MTANAVVCKFRVNRIERQITTRWNAETKEYEPAEQNTVVLYAVGEQRNPEDSAFWLSTPTGEMKVAMVNPELVARFPLDGEVFVTLTPA